MKHGTKSVSEGSVSVDSANAIFVRGACMAIALFARWECSPRRALKEMRITREQAVQSGLNAFDLAQLKPYWPKPIAQLRKVSRKNRQA